jgi:hypothetical protein
MRSSAYGPLRKHPEELCEFAITLIFGDLFLYVDHIDGGSVRSSASTTLASVVIGDGRKSKLVHLGPEWLVPIGIPWQQPSGRSR